MPHSINLNVVNFLITIFYYAGESSLWIRTSDWKDPSRRRRYQRKPLDKRILSNLKRDLRWWIYTDDSSTETELLQLISCQHPTHTRTHAPILRKVRSIGRHTYGRAGKFTNVHLFFCARVRARASDGHNTPSSNFDVCYQFSNRYINGKISISGGKYIYSYFIFISFYVNFK